MQPRQTYQTSMTNKIKIATYNIAGIQRETRFLQMLRFCSREKIDLVCLQEVSFVSCAIFESAYSVFSNPGPHKRGTALLGSSTLLYCRKIVISLSLMPSLSE